MKSENTTKIAILVMAAIFGIALLVSCSPDAENAGYTGATVTIEVPAYILESAEQNYQDARGAVMLTERSDGDICNTMAEFGFDLEGDPFKELSDYDKVIAFNQVGINFDVASH